MAEGYPALPTAQRVRPQPTASPLRPGHARVGVMVNIAAALTFTWLGMVLGISFLEAPLKFRAAGITLSLGLGIGRIVFRALNLVEVVLAIAIMALVLGSDHSLAETWTLAAVVLCLAVQVVGIRRLLNVRTDRVLAGDDGPGSKIHLVYIALEVAKVALLIALGSQLLD
jgi:hypothetical protein